MLLEPREIGVQALNKIAEAALATQFNEFDKLTVNIQTNPVKLAQGQLESLTILGTGLVMRKDLRMQELEIFTTNSISINPLKALVANLELNYPTQGQAYITLTEEDIDRAFNSEFFKEQREHLELEIEGQLVKIDIKKVRCYLLADGQIYICAKIFFQRQQETKEICFTTTAEISPCRRSVLLNNVQYTEDQELSPKLTDALVDKAREILHLSNYEIEGISLLLNQLQIEEGQLTLEATAEITRFP